MTAPRRRPFEIKGRWFERLFLRNRAVNGIISAAGKAVLTCLIWPRFVAPFRWELTRFDMPLAAGEGLNGYRILHLTDLHAGRTRVDYLERVIRDCLAQKPDIVVITGDLIDYDPKALPPIRRLLKVLADAGVPDGVAAIFGNHDYHEYSWRKVGKRSAHRSIQKRLVALVREHGVRLLRNEQLWIERAGARMVFVGLDEMWSDLADAGAAFSGLTAADPVVCLQHNPDGVEFLKPWPWQYVLTGHSHGGQAVLPGLGALYVPMEHRQYLRGFFKFPPLPGQQVSQRTMFVSRGLGYSTPIRMNCSPEATLFTVRPAVAPDPNSSV
jgi:predicted MPP superfamily phosphohydrolase